MDINDNQQINTFIKGMNTDISDMMLDPGLYRYAENVRLVTNTNSDTGELRIVDGNTNVYEFGQDEVLYLNSIQNYIVAIVRSGETWTIEVCENIDDRDKNKKIKWESIFGPCRTRLWKGNKPPHISGVLRWESDKNIKFYFVDDTGEHGIMSINIVGPKPKTNDIKELTGYESQFLRAPEVIIGSSIGLLMPAKVQYAYRLYKLGGGVTNISVLSKPLSLYKNDKEGYNSEQKTSRSVDISVYNINSQILNRIQLYRITYNINGNLPIISCIYDGTINGSTFRYTDTGTEKYQISSEEFLALDSIRVSPKIIESKENYMFAANIHDEQDDINTMFKDIDTVAWTSGMTDKSDPYKHNQFVYTNCVPEYNESYWHNKEGKIGGDGKYVSWELVEKTITLRPELGLSIRDQIKSFKHGEVYRFGIIFYDTKGRKTSVKWVADIMIPLVKDTDVLLNHDTSILAINVDPAKIKFEYKYYTIKFKLADTNQFPKEYAGYEIVRCKRGTEDSISLSQGIIGFPLQEGSGEQNEYSEIYNPGILTLQTMYIEKYKNNPNSSYNHNWKPARDVVMFASPECVYLPDDMEQLFSLYRENLKIKCILDYYPLTQETTGSESLKHIYLPSIRFNTPVIVQNSLRFKSSNRSEVPDLPDYCLWFHQLNEYANPIRFNYLYPNTKRNINDYFKNNEVTSVVYSESPNWDEFESADGYMFRDSSVVVPPYTFINWSGSIPNNIPDEEMKGLENISGDWSFSYPISAGGRVFLFKLQNSVYYRSSSRTRITPITIANITKDCEPYGGYSEFAINNSTFYSYGDSNPNTILTIYVESGDACPWLFSYIACHEWYGAKTAKAPQRMSTVYIVPLETNIDLRAQSGQLFDSKNESGWTIQYLPAMISGLKYTQDKPAYVYNTAYNQDPTLVALGVDEEKEIYSPNYTTRIFNSEPKTNGEDIDSWLIYKPMNYIDVDSRYGDITELKLFKEHLTFWQPDATGIISSNERIIVQDTNGTNLILGTGSVMQRYDYISTIYGMKRDLFADIQSNSALYWWDGSEKELLQYVGGAQVVPLSTTKSVKTYLNKHNEVDRPNLLYNNKYKEVVAHVVNNESIVYNEQIEAFTSIYKFTPIYNTSLLDRELVCDGNNLEELDTLAGNAVELFGTEVYPLVQYVINKNNAFVKTFDIQVFGGRFYGGEDFKDINFEYNTPLKQKSVANGKDVVTTREYDFRLNIPRAVDETGKPAEYGDRMRGKTMQCELSSTSNSKDFSLQYITTKYRISWS